MFTADRPNEQAGTVSTDEGELRWVRLDEVTSLPVVSDIPLILPHLFGPDAGVLMGRIHCDNDDADSIVDYEFRTA